MSARNQRALARMVHSLSGVAIALYVTAPLPWPTSFACRCRQ